MTAVRRFRVVGAAASALLMSGCVAAVPAAPQLTVIPGQGKTSANLQSDDAVCRGAPVVAQGATRAQDGPAINAAAPATAVTADQYYACMASRGEIVVEAAPQPYPASYAAYAAYPYPYYPYAYPYPYGYYGYGYPYAGGYFGPYVGFGVGFGFGRFYGGRGYYGGGYRGGFGGGYHGGYGGGYHGGYGGGYGGGFHGGGGGRR